jgi:hypothetical protein
LPFSAIDAITPAFEHTRQQLFRPFRLGQWTRLAIVGLLAGELGSGGLNRSNFSPARHGGLGGLNLGVVIGLIGVIILAALVLGIIFMYISSVMRFVLFDSVLTRQCHIRAGWIRRQGPGLRYFLWQLGYLLAVLAAMVVLVGIPLGFAFAAGWLNHPSAHMVPLVLSGIVLFFVLLIFFVVMAVIVVLTKDFVVPQMALEEIGAVQAWRRLWPMIMAEKGGYAGYIGMKILMAIGAGIVVGIAALILGLFFAIPTVGLGILAVMTGKAAGLTWDAYTITLAIVVGSFLLAIFLYLIALISVPVIVFFPAYSIYFFAARYPALSRVLYPAPPVPAASQISPGAPPPYQPPPLPPTPEPIG